MENKRRVLTLKTSNWFGKSWLVDENGERCSEKFKVVSKQRCGPITALNTSVGAILYSRYNPETKHEFCAVWDEIVRLAENVYLAKLDRPGLGRNYYLYDAELKPVLKEFICIEQVQLLTKNLLAIKSYREWGIVDITTGEIVCEPQYFDIVVKNGKFIGRKRDTKVIVTETEINI